jgi:hypothetical protein
MFIYTTNATTLILGRRLIANEHNLSLYSPLDVHKRQAHTVPLELEIASLGLGLVIEPVENLNKLNTVDFLIFPTLDVDYAEKRMEFGTMCKDIFR